jgi:hypothetical protein
MVAMKRKPVRIVVVENKLFLLCDDGTMWLGHTADAPEVAWQQVKGPPDAAESATVGFGPART